MRFDTGYGKIFIVHVAAPTWIVAWGDVGKEFIAFLTVIFGDLCMG